MHKGDRLDYLCGYIGTATIFKVSKSINGKVYNWETYFSFKGLKKIFTFILVVTRINKILLNFDRCALLNIDFQRSE